MFSEPIPLLGLELPPQDLVWNSIHPSDMTCARKAVLHLTAPGLGDPNSWDELKGLTEVGKALHAHILPLIAEQYRQRGFVTEVEKEIEWTYRNELIRGRIDLLVTNGSEHLIIDLKFVHPQAVYRCGTPDNPAFPHHLYQVALYAKIISTSDNIPVRAAIYYIARDLLSYKILPFTPDQLQKTYEEKVQPFLDEVITAKQTIEAGQWVLPPALNPDTYPCIYSTMRGTAKCPFYNFCYPMPYDIPDALTSSNPIATGEVIDRDLSSMLEEYFRTYAKIEELKGQMKPLENKLEQLKEQFRTRLEVGKVYASPWGKLRMKIIARTTLDTKSIRKVLEDLGIKPPEKVTEYPQFDVELNPNAFEGSDGNE